MRISPAVLLLATAAALTACSSSDEPSKAPASSSSHAAAPAAAAGDPCVLLSAADVSKAIAVPGLTAVAGPSENNAANGGKARSCEYQLNGKPAGALAVTRYEGKKLAPKDMITALKKGKPGSQDVPGFPDGAVYYVDAQKTATLATAKLQQGVPVLINYTGPAKMTVEMMTPLVKTAYAAKS